MFVLISEISHFDKILICQCTDRHDLQHDSTRMELIAFTVLEKPELKKSRLRMKIQMKTAFKTVIGANINSM